MLDNTKKAVEFLKSFIPNGLWVLTAIDPEKKRNIETRTFSAATADQAEDWIADRNGVDNLYFSVNQPEEGNYNRKLKKEEIAVVHYLHVDVDPAKGKEIDFQRKQIFDKLTSRRPEAVPRPSIIVDSGGGYQAFWKLEEPQIVENPNQRGAVELFNVWLQDTLGGDNCHNLDRIMRLPWTMNKPNAVKKQAGRVETLARPKQIEEISYKLADFSLEAPEPAEGDQDKPTPKKVDSRAIEDEISQEISAGPLYVENIEEFGEKYGIPRRTLHIIVDGKGDEEEQLKKKQAGKEYSRSEWLFDVVCELERRSVPRRLTLGIIMEPNVDKFAISDSVINNKDYPSPLDYAVRQIRKAAKMVAEAELEKVQIAESMEDPSLENRHTEIYKLCRGERPNLDGVQTREEAESVDPLLKALNSFLVYVTHYGGGKPRVVTWSRRPEIGAGKMFVLDKSTYQEFQLQYKGLKVITGYSKPKTDETPKPITKALSEWWIEHRFKNIKKRVAFAPEMNLPGILNEWTGFTYPEDPNGKYDLFLEHVRENICNGNEDYFTYIKKWCARMYQKPGEVGEVGIFLRGGSGVGKSVFAQVLGNMIESNFFKTAQTKKLSNFNSVLRTTILLFLDEPSLDLREYDVLKRLLTDNGLDIEAKGFETENAKNCLHILFASNHSKVAQLDTDDRRLCVLQVGDKRKGDEDFFGAIFDQLEENNNAGYKALFHFFRTMDLTGFKIRLYPKTEVLAEQKDLSLRPLEQWLLDRLEDGELVQGTGDWPELVATAKVRDDFLEELKKTNTKADDNDKSKRVFGMFLSKTIGTKPKSAGLGISGYKVPTIQECRANWEKKYGARVWPELSQEPVTIDVPDVETEVTRGKYTNKQEEKTPF